MCLLSLALVTGAAAANWQVKSGGALLPSTRDLPIPLREFGLKEGLPHNVIYEIAYGPDDQIYVGTPGGLARYDGIAFESVTLDADTGAVRSLMLGRDGLWVGAERGLWLGDGEHWRQIAPAAMRAVNAVAERAAGGVWIGSEHGLFQCLPTHGCSEALVDFSVASLLESQYLGRQVLWCTDDSRGLTALELDTLNRGEAPAPPFWLSRADGLPNNAVRALINWPSNSEVLWVGLGRGLVRLEGKQLTVWRDADVLGMAGVFDLKLGLAEDGSERLYAATFGGGLLSIDAQQKIEALTVEQGLPENHFYALLIDPNTASTWLGGSKSGVSRTDSGRWFNFHERHGLAHRATVGLGPIGPASESPARIWAGTISGSVLFERGHWQPFLPEPYKHWALYDLVALADDERWLATDRGLLHWHGEQIKLWSSDNAPLPGLSIVDLERHPFHERDAVWVATRHGLAVIQDGVIKRPEMPSILSEAGVRGMRSAPMLGGGTLFLFAKGLQWLDRTGKLTSLPAHCSVSDTVYAIRARPDRGEREWWLAGQGGLTRIRFNRSDLGGSDIECTHVAGLKSQWLFALEFAHSGELYVYGYGGVYRIAASELDGALRDIELSRHDESDGLPDLAINRDAWIDPKGRIWTAHAGGVAVLAPRNEVTKAEAPAFRFVAAESALGPLRPGAALPAQYGEVTIQWRLLAFVREQHIRYRTQLEGLDETPSAWHREVERHYARLPPGSFNLKVWARDGLGRELAPINFAFTVEKPWWQRWWAWLIAIVSLVGLGVLTGRLRLRALKHRAGQLERQVNERTALLAHANHQLELLSLTDPLTGCYNRRCYYERYLQRALPPMPRLVLVFDIDHFKRINDQHGHDAGDLVLTEFAKRLRAFGYPVFRMGGEEFLMLDVDADPDAFLSSVLDAIAGHGFELGDCSLKVSCSIGAIQVADTGDFERHLTQALRLADQALYRAKTQGRNQAVLVLGTADRYRDHVVRGP